MIKAWFALSLVVCGGCTLFAGKADYADYRQIRLAGDLQSRAIAMQRYVERHPGGHWHEEIQTARASQELATFEAGKDTRAGIEHYLRAYPDGSFVAQARGRLSAIALIEQRNLQAQHQAEELAQARKQRTDELRRTWVGRFIAYWAKTLTSVRNWGEPIATVAQANPQFSRAFAAQPRPRCTQDECVKYYTSQFAVPVPGGNRIERSLTLLLRLRMRAGKLESAELLLPDQGFSRWYEIENRRSVAQGDPEGRAVAAAWAMERLEPIIRALGDELVPLTDATLPTIERPAIGPTGELTDTSIESPSDPQNRVSSEPDNAGIGVAAMPDKAEPTVAELVKPNDQPSADMVFTPLNINKQGQLVPGAKPSQQATAAAAVGGEEGGGEVMVLDPLAVPKNDEAAAGTPSAAPASSAAATASTSAPAEATTPERETPPVGEALVRGFAVHGLRVVAFASGQGGSPGYDGLAIQPMPAARSSARAPKAAGRGGQPAPSR